MGASGFLNHVSGEAIATLGAIRSVPLLWAWLQVMATEPVGARHPAGHGLAPGRWCWRVGLAVEWAMRRAVRRPILALVRRAPNGGAPAPTKSGEARAERGETEPPHRRRLAALTLLRRVPLVLGRCVLELLPVLAFLVVGHLVAATALGGDGPAPARAARGDRRLRALRRPSCASRGSCSRRRSRVCAC